MMFQKKKRHVDQDILEKYRKGRCVICSSVPCDPCHIGTRGAGYPDADFNLFSACRQHHTEQGQIGHWKMAQKYPFYGQMLAQKGWIFDGFKKLRREEYNFSGFSEKRFGVL